MNWNYALIVVGHVSFVYTENWWLVLSLRSFVWECICAMVFSFLAMRNEQHSRNPALNTIQLVCICICTAVTRKCLNIWAFFFFTVVIFRSRDCLALNLSDFPKQDYCSYTTFHCNLYLHLIICLDISSPSLSSLHS